MTNGSTIGVVIADTQFLIIEALRGILSVDQRFELSGVALTRNELIRQLTLNSSQLVLTDYSSFDFEGIEDLKSIKFQFPKAIFVVLVNSLSKAEFLNLSRLGIRNIIYKSCDREELFMALDSALRGKKFYSEEILDQYMNLDESKNVPEESKTLTSTEIEIVKQIADGLTTKEIALKKHISHHTVNTHRKNIFRKLEVSNASELIMVAIKAGWINNIEFYI